MAILIVSVLLAVLLVLFVYVLVTPNVKSETFVLGKNTAIDPTISKAVNFLGGDIAAMIPDSAKKKNRRNHKLKRLFITSGNPWNLTMDEFLVVRVFIAASAFILAILIAVLFSSIFNVFVSVIVVIGFTFFGFMYPQIVYTSTSNDRIKAFKRELPEAIDYLVIAMSGGSYSLPSAIEKTVTFLPEGVMREEFRKITDSIHSGKSLETSLDEFAQRAPTEGIEAFVNALNNAARLNAPVVEILKNRSRASRDELNAEVDKKISTLSTKVMMIFGPTAYIAILLVVLVPIASSLIGML